MPHSIGVKHYVQTEAKRIRSELGVLLTDLGRNKGRNDAELLRRFLSIFRRACRQRRHSVK